MKSRKRREPSPSGPATPQLLIRPHAMGDGLAYAVWVEGLTRDQAVALLSDPGSILGRLGTGLEIAEMMDLMLEREGRPLMVDCHKDETHKTYSIRVACLDRGEMYDTILAWERALGREVPAHRGGERF